MSATPVTPALSAGVEPDQLETPAPPTPQPDNPAAAGPAPSVAQVAPPSLSPDQQQTLSTPPQTQQPQFELDNRPGLWHRVLVGALGGLVHGGAVGALVGGVAGGIQTEDQAKRAALQQAQADELNQATMKYKIQFAHAQAASAVADAAVADAKIQQLPEQIQFDQFKRGTDALEAADKLGLKPTVISENSEQGAGGALEGLTASRGSIPYLAILHIGDQHIGFSLPDAANDASAVAVVNDYLAKTNQQPIDKSTFDALPASVQQTYLKNSIEFGTEVATAKDAAGLASKYRSYADSYAGSDPAVKAKLENVAKSYENSRDWYAQHDSDLIAAKAAAQQQNKMHEPVVVAQPDGTNQVMERSQVPAGQFSYKVDPVKINSTVAGFNDVQTKINALSQVDFSKVQGPLAAAMLEEKGVEISLHGAAGGVDLPTARVNTGLYQENLAKANQSTRDFVTAYLGAHEAMTQLPRLQTFGQSSRMTEQQMKAAQQQLPGAGDDPAMARQKLDAVQNIIDPLRKQVPRMPGAALIPSYREK